MHRLDHLPPLSGRHATAVAAAVAQSLADLHAYGQSHGGIGPDRVWVAADGAVRLAAPAPAEAETGAVDDIAALGRLLAWLADRAPDRPARRPALLAPPPPVEVLRELARCCAGGDELRPTADKVASALRTSVPDACFPTADAGARPVRHRRRVALGSAAAVVLAGAVALPTRCAPRPPSVDRPAAPVWADGLLVVDGRRYAVGAPGDDVVIGRWRCARSRVLFLLRAATGDLVRFDRLPVDSRPRAGHVVARLPDARRLVTGRDARGCATVSVSHADGHITPVPTVSSP